MSLRLDASPEAPEEPTIHEIVQIPGHCPAIHVHQSLVFRSCDDAPAFNPLECLDLSRVEAICRTGFRPISRVLARGRRPSKEISGHGLDDSRRNRKLVVGSPIRAVAVQEGVGDEPPEQGREIAGVNAREFPQPLVRHLLLDQQSSR